MAGILYVIFNESIRNPETNERLYKIGITKNSITERYYGLGLKMPGKFVTLFAYKFENYEKAEQLIHGIFSKYRENGEWFNLNQKQLDLIKANCEEMGGISITDEYEKEIEIEKKQETDNKINVRQSSVSSDLQNITNIVDLKILKSILERGTLYVSDTIRFHTTVDVLNSLFDKNYKQGFAAFGKCAFWTKKRDKFIWCPILDREDESWTNTMPDENHLIQKHNDERYTKLKDDNIESNPDRATFVKRVGSEYQFVGIFHVEKRDSNIEYLKRISSELHLQEWI